MRTAPRFSPLPSPCRACPPLCLRQGGWYSCHPKVTAPLRAGLPAPVGVVVLEVVMVVVAAAVMVCGYSGRQELTGDFEATRMSRLLCRA